MSSRSVRTKPAAASRREFIKKSSLLLAGGAVTGPLVVPRGAYAFGGDTIKIGLIGCGRAGRRAAAAALHADNGEIRLVAMADLFADRLQAAYRGLKSRHGRRMDVPRDRQFLGFDSHQGVLQSDADLVLLCCPPAFRPKHFAAAVCAGKHVFMEKPVAVDGAGVRRVLAANEEAKRKGLAVRVGLYRRHESRYRETIRRLRDGAIGEILLTRVYRNLGGLPLLPRRPEWTELEYQLRNWCSFAWLSGGCVVEQHVDNLDVGNWVKSGIPVQCNGMGGRQADEAGREGRDYDHQVCEFTFADGSKMISQSRRISHCWCCTAEHAHGTRGAADISGAKIYRPDGQLVWRFGKGGGGGVQTTLRRLAADLRAGRAPNEVESSAWSTMTAILGRSCVSSGQLLRMEDALKSDDAVSPAERLARLEDAPPVPPDADGRCFAPSPGDASEV